MPLIRGLQHNYSKMRAVVLVAACSLFLSLSACSDNQGNDGPTGKDSSSQVPPVHKAALQTQSAVPTPVQTSPATSPVGSCASLATAKCIECHSMTRVCEKLGRKSKSRWKRTIRRMIDRGAKIDSGEAATLLDCLDSGVKDLQSLCQ